MRTGQKLVELRNIRIFFIVVGFYEPQYSESDVLRVSGSLC